jgi:hypothetical protein
MTSFQLPGESDQDGKLGTDVGENRFGNRGAGKRDWSRFGIDVAYVTRQNLASDRQPYGQYDTRSKWAHFRRDRTNDGKSARPPKIDW